MNQPSIANRLRPRSMFIDNGKPRVLAVEDEPAIADALDFGLSSEGFQVMLSHNGEDALDSFTQYGPDVVILDLMLPKLSGTEVCKQIRAQSSVPIIVLSAKDTEIDKVLGLELGADDYVTKPFSMRELSARIRAVLRRAQESNTEPSHELEIRGVHIDTERHEVRVRGEYIDVPPKEFALLELLVRNAGRVLTRDIIINRIWGVDYVGDTKTLDVHIKRLRSRVELDPSHPTVIQTVRGVGYKCSD